MTEIFLKAGFVLYAAAAFFIAIPPGVLKRGSEKLTQALLSSGFAFHTCAIAFRWHAAGRPPFASMYESLVLFSWAIIAVYFAFTFLYRASILRVPGLILALCLMTAALFGDSAVKPLVPALQSRWIGIHVITYFIGYGALSLAFMLGVLYIVSKRRAAGTEQLRSLDVLMYRLVIFGFPFLTVGMTTGSAWADAAWGTYWGWDPKETCSLITWLVYIVYLHMRILCGWKDTRAAWLCIFGFLATLFTFIGVNFILPGLHSYQ
ncbi:MAG TPA: c-type cytochrome biogenesis protein CcsB [Candidatus Omnitrophota bacterium]|nr:c-type cytochrome biogenesis protein CcsB [Candidatus Omnitrophota bacterium]HQJ15052.1 c-type cytochrome biogenesis protein CcsB [Candidatus Omnitrophota bacterium]